MGHLHRAQTTSRLLHCVIELCGCVGQRWCEILEAYICFAHGCKLSGEALPRAVVAGVALLPLQPHGSAVCSPFRMCVFWVSVSKGSSHVGEALVLAVSQALKGT